MHIGEAMSQRTASHARDKSAETAPVQASRGALRLTVRRVRLRSVARVGFSIGWLISFLPSLIASIAGAWALHNVWRTLNGWDPWTPWARDTRIAGFTLPTPEFRPREALRVEGFYQFLEPIGQHPFLGAFLGTVALTALGGAVVALTMLLAALGYNLFSAATGGLELEVTSPRPHDPQRGPDWDEDADLQWE